MRHVPSVPASLLYIVILYLVLEALCPYLDVFNISTRMHEHVFPCTILPTVVYWKVQKCTFSVRTQATEYFVESVHTVDITIVCSLVFNLVLNVQWFLYLIHVKALEPGGCAD